MDGSGYPSPARVRRGREQGERLQRGEAHHHIEFLSSDTEMSMTGGGGDCGFIERGGRGDGARESAALLRGLSITAVVLKAWLAGNWTGNDCLSVFV